MADECGVGSDFGVDLGVAGGDDEWDGGAYVSYWQLCGAITIRWLSLDGRMWAADEFMMISEPTLIYLMLKAVRAVSCIYRLGCLVPSIMVMGAAGGWRLFRRVSVSGRRLICPWSWGPQRAAMKLFLVVVWRCCLTAG